MANDNWYGNLQLALGNDEDMPDNMQGWGGRAQPASMSTVGGGMVDPNAIWQTLKQQGASNYSRELQNLGDSSIEPKNKMHRAESHAAPLVNALNSAGYGPGSTQSFADHIKGVVERANQTRSSMDDKHSTGVRGLNDLANMLAQAGPSDIDGFAQAFNFQKLLGDYDQQRQQQEAQQFMQGRMGDVGSSRIARQSYLNSRGVQEFTPGGIGGDNFNKLDSWQAIGAARDKERQGFIDQITGLGAAGIQAHQMAYQHAQRQADLANMLQQMTGMQQVQKNGIALQSLPAMMKAQLAEQEAKTAQEQGLAAERNASARGKGMDKLDPTASKILEQYMKSGGDLMGPEGQQLAKSLGVPMPGVPAKDPHSHIPLIGGLIDSFNGVPANDGTGTAAEAKPAVKQAEPELSEDDLAYARKHLDNEAVFKKYGGWFKQKFGTDNPAEIKKRLGSRRASGEA